LRNGSSNTEDFTLRSAFDVQHADEREEPTGRGKIDLNFTIKSFHQQLGCFIVHTAPRHIDGFDFGGTRLANGLIVTVANGEIVFHHPAEAAQAEDEHFMWRIIGAANVEDEAAVGDADAQMIWPGIAIAHITQRLEEVVFDQIEDRDAPLLLDIGIAPKYRCFV
jgi:hypothetical protein